VRRVLVLVCLLVPIAAHADDGSAGQLRGTAAFDGGHGHITLGGGYESFGVEALGTGLVIAIDGETVHGLSDGRVAGNLLDGQLSYLLPGETQGTWLGRNLSLVFDIEHGWGDREQAATDNSRMVSTGLSFLMSSGDGRAVAYADSTISGATAVAAALGTGNSQSSFCAQASGAVSTIAAANGSAAALAGCIPSASDGIAIAESADNGGAVYSAAARAMILSGTPFSVVTGALTRYDIEDSRGDAVMTGDFELAPLLTLSPSFGFVAGRRQLKFLSENASSGVDNGTTAFFVVGVVAGSLTSKDAGLQGGSRLNYEALPGLDIFASAKGALVFRRTQLQTLDFVIGGIKGTDVGIYPARHEETQEHAAFQGGLEIGGSYTFGADWGLGALRAALSGGLRYDSAAATYRHVNASLAFDPPYAPAGIDFGSEIDYQLKGELTVELP
jgi:hypothetical protein